MAKAKETVRVATLTINHSDKMTEEGRMELQTWLIGQARAVRREGEKYSKRFIARYDVQPVVRGMRWFK